MVELDVLFGIGCTFLAAVLLLAHGSSCTNKTTRGLVLNPGEVITGVASVKRSTFCGWFVVVSVDSLVPRSSILFFSSPGSTGAFVDVVSSKKASVEDVNVMDPSNRFIAAKARLTARVNQSEMEHTHVRFLGCSLLFRIPTMIVSQQSRQQLDVVVLLCTFRRAAKPTRRSSFDG